MDEIEMLKERLVTASRVMANEGLCKGPGHISVRIPGTDSFLIPPQMSPALVRFEDILTFNLASEVVEGHRTPNTETPLHTCIYRARPDVQSVAHTHSHMVIVLGVVGQSIKPLHNDGARYFAGGVPLFTTPGLIHNDEIGTEVAAMLGQHRAIMLRGHGAITIGPDVEQTCRRAICLEESAMLQVWATAIGQPMYYSDEELKNTGFPAKEPAPGMSMQLRRSWDYYLSKLPPQL